MTVISRDDIQGDCDALRAVVSRFLGHSYDALTNPERLRLLEVLEQEMRRLQAPRHQLINQVAAESDSTELGGKLAWALAGRLHISRAEAGRRVAEAADLGPRRAMTGESLAPGLPATVAAQRDGSIGAEHAGVIRRFFHQLPECVDIGTREQAQKHLAAHASQFRPDQLAKLADHLMTCLNPDGNYTDEDRARARGLVLGNQQADGMSRLSGSLMPEARAGWEAVLAKLAAPGMANPDDDAPVVDGTNSFHHPEELLREDDGQNGEDCEEGAA